MNFDKLVGFLEKRTELPLPGTVAHQKMQPKMTNGLPLKLKHDQDPRKGGVLILFYQDAGKLRFPIIERTSYEGIHSNQMALPGGRYEEQDEDQVTTAIREAEEEVGVIANEIEIIGCLSEFFVAASNYMVLPVLAKVDHKPNFISQPREVAEIVLPSVDDLINPDKLLEKEIVVKGGFKMNCPYFDLEGKVVWGATAMMLSELVEILNEQEFA